MISVYSNFIIIEEGLDPSFLENVQKIVSIKINKIKKELSNYLSQEEINKVEDIAHSKSRKAAQLLKSGDKGAIVKCFNEAIYEMRELGFFQKLSKSLMLLFVVFFLNTFIFSTLVVFFGGPIGFFLGAVIVAPFVEEWGKMISIREKYPGFYYIVFNVAEFSKYVIEMTTFYGIPLTIAVLARIPALLMHALTTIIQYKYKDTSESQKTGYKIGVFVHSLFNFLACQIRI